MKEIAVSEFKAKCLGLIAEVEKTRRPIRLTKFGKPVAELVPSPPDKHPDDWLGCMRGTARILGDIVGPISDENDWEAAR
jgi:prevent-host-death family protein